jgi:hypothetical protein
MSSLKEQLAKLGMIEESESTQSAPRSWTAPKPTKPPQQTRESTRRPNTKGRRGTPSHRSDKKQSHTQRNPPLPYRSDLSDEERATEIAKLLKQARVPLPPYGSNRFYFELKGGLIDYLDTDQESHDALSYGKVMIVADPQGRAIAIPRSVLRELNSLDPKWIPRSK